MTDVEEFIGDVIEHHGVKGQKWGIRNDRGHAGERAKTKKIAKLDKKFAKSASSTSTLVKIYNAAAQQSNDVDIPRINNKPQYKNADFRRDTPLRRRYYAEHHKALLDNLEKAANALGTNASGTQRYTIEESSNGDWRISLEDVNHASDGSIAVKVNKDAMGRITSLEIREPMMSHADFIEGFIEHHGVKGMHWGIRNKKNKNRVKKSSSDHKKTADLRKKKPHELSNKQLQNANARANLEKNFKSLNPGSVEKGHAAVKSILSIAGTASAVFTLSQTPAGKAFIEAGKKFFAKRG